MNDIIGVKHGLAQETATTNPTLPQQISRMDLDRLKAYRENLDFYNGLQWLGHLRHRERRLTFNYARVFVDKATSYLMSGLSFAIDPVSPEDKEKARRAEEAIYRVYETNNLDQLDFDTEIDAAILGDGCFKVTWDSQEKRVRVSAPDVQGIFVWWLGDDVTRVWRVASRYQLSADEVRLLYNAGASFRGRMAPTASKPRSTIVEVWTDRKFELWIDDLLFERKANPYGFIPFVIFPNTREPKKFWGVSDIPAIIEPARELNRALSQLSRILELSGNPIAVLENIENAQDIAVQPGAVWEIPEQAKAYLLDLLQGGGVKLHADYIDLLYRTLHDLSESPRTAFGDNQRGLSGIALEMELHPLLQKVRRKRLIRTAVYRRRNDLILRVLERMTGESFGHYRSRIIWGPILPQDRGRLVRDEEILISTGVHSRRRAMDELGVEDPDAEFQRWLEEEEKIPLPRTKGR
ncbi:MAG: phage portal protein [Dehalococcoidia bacterium]|nr:MAG: phage portal protein [Dehalococcoidia bacterium]